MTSPNVLLIGCGKMGGALAQGWMAAQNPPKLMVLDRKLQQAPGDSPIVRAASDIPADFQPDIIVLAVKPAGADAMLATLRDALGERLHKSALLSVMAGKTCDHLAQACGWDDMAVIRTMPNTPSSVGAGTTGLYASPHVSEAQKQIAITLMKQVGTVVPVSRETDLRSIIAIAGSAPAYIFFLTELLEKTGVELGLTAEQSRELARSMMYGAGKMLHDLPEDASTLRKNVTSPNGTTAAALAVFMDENNWPRTVKLAAQAAVRRSEELDN
ncbi:pyrroline-5-carboxylate reductase [Saccharibacter floricola]|uniref:Pyrroline-5-carboxylate reductase n=1 Tax=Saccharibacter floricola DSM 15669 TaxID=1123227 RepID=A0ABQ0NWR4_9PROT|nr:pyrroline-5-carboxylate reductase [Saccharibacter floricola]GBQ05280.1 pyrroline-5-carboxylate reductase [Saccharibacter floricola DSM 15669]